MKRNIITVLSLLGLVFICTNCSVQNETAIVTGADQTEAYLSDLEGKNVGITLNHSSLIGSKSSLDSLVSLGVKVVKVFGPEHGFRGDASDGDPISNDIDKETGVPVVSLYGNYYKPTPEDLAGLDVMIFDIQDVGVRFYTYLATLHHVMEACAENGVQVIVLDRPNPNDFYIDGPILEKEFTSFVGLDPIPILHGMTFGEYAGMLNGEGWLENGIKCDLKVVKMLNYEHGKPYILPVPPSPNLNTQQSILLYPSLCLFEGTIISQGRGTYFPFTVLGNPELKEKYSFSFTPDSIKGMSERPPHRGLECYGIDLREYDTDIFRETGRINLDWLIEFYNAYPNKENFFNPYFEKLAGTSSLREQIIAGKTEDEIRASWEPGLSEFKETRLKYRLYK